MSRAEVFLAETVRMSVPLVACALGAIATERSGVVNIALEGTLVVSGLAAAVFSLSTGSPWAGLVAASAAGALYCALHGVMVVKARVDAIVSGVALNIIAFGLSRVVLRVLYDSASNSPRLPGFASGSLESPLGRVLADPAFLAVALLVPGLWALLGKTRFGLRLRASGDDAEAARAAGVEVDRVRLLASALCGAIAGVGGAHLALDQRHFDAGMSGGRGFIALAGVLLGGYRPAAVALSCLGFAALEATQIAVQDRAHVPPELVQMLPYVATLVLLSTVARGRRWGQG